MEEVNVVCKNLVRKSSRPEVIIFVDVFFGGFVENR
jgi:hypothetical protein